MTYERWIKNVDFALAGMVGLGHDDVIDFDWYSLWEDEFTPTKAVFEWQNDPEYGMMSNF